MAMIIAHENMNIYAYMSILEVLLKLGIVFLLRFIEWDKLKLYSLLMVTIALIITGIYRLICIKKYKECSFSFYWNKDLFKEITSYSGWNLFGTASGIFKNQIVNILLNQFFNPMVVAARSIATQVDNAAMSLSQNFSTAIRPQIIKSYATEEKEMMLSLMFRGSKGTYLLMYLFVLPLVLEMPMILGLWLKNPPEYTVLFTRLMLVDILITSMSYPIMTVAQATGTIMLYQSVVGGIILLNVPFSWIILQMGAPAYSVLIIAISIAFIATIARLLILKRLVDYSIGQFLRIVLIPVLIISIVSSILPVIVCCLLPQNILRLLLVTGTSVISVGLYSFYIGLNGKERKKIKNVIDDYISAMRMKNETC
jgi:O-antigen/teichoic acid export membrane protein